MTLSKKDIETRNKYNLGQITGQEYFHYLNKRLMRLGKCKATKRNAYTIYELERELVWLFKNGRQ